MREFHLRIKCIVDALGSCGDPVLPHEHLDAILEGLPEEYSPVIESKFEPLLIGEVEALQLTHEGSMKKFQKHFPDSSSINVAQGYNSSSNSYNSSSNDFSSQNRSNYSGNHGDFNRGSGYNRGGSDSDRGGGYNRGGNGFGCAGGCCGGSRGRGRYANFQYQRCFKFGHTIAVCHFRYDSDFQPNASLTLMEPVFQSNSSNTFGSKQDQGTNSHKDSQPSAMLLILKIKILTLLLGYLIQVHRST